MRQRLIKFAMNYRLGASPNYQNYLNYKNYLNYQIYKNYRIMALRPG